MSAKLGVTMHWPPEGGVQFNGPTVEAIEARMLELRNGRTETPAVTPPTTPTRQARKVRRPMTAAQRAAHSKRMKEVAAARGKAKPKTMSATS